MLEAVTEFPGTLPAPVENLQSCLEVKSEIELCAERHHIDRNRAHRRDEPGGGCDKRLELVLAAKIHFKPDRIDPPAVNSFAARGADESETARSATRNVSWLGDDFEWNHVKGVLQRSRRLVV